MNWPSTMEGEVTYLDVKIAPKRKRDHPSPGPRFQHPCWCVATVPLGIAALLLLVTVVYLNAYGKNNCKPVRDSKISCEDASVNESSAKLATLKEELCTGQQSGDVCELCPQGWQLNSNRCYYFSGERQTWDDSVRDCAKRKSWLLVLEDKAESELVSKMKPRDEYFWIGYKYNITQKNWTCLDNTGFSGYRITVKKHLNGNDCACLKTKDAFASEGCLRHQHWICKRNVTVLEL
ncbi:killer cell lectin-like receptor subfamily B member 1B allele B [Ornithorhynchus anatinus]|uniref:C-type lectin domain-containing protein n=2 Tax=Ornithorhynchus anatinus TaxID=9258 RepID=A0A6I8NPG4_ORNAN|nr:killer cell lectin-like receptor subfamily B member 1B allele B [Ornithorhynchus anatinus]